MAKMTTAPDELAPMEQTRNADLSAILARLDAAEAKNKELESKLTPENKFLKSKEKYKGPWDYSYKMWGDVPVLSYKSEKKDKTKDFSYKDHLGILINNQKLLLTLADGEELRVDSTEFGHNFTRSEKQRAEPLKDGQPFVEHFEGELRMTGDSYKFTHPTYGEFIVLSNFIN